MRALKDKHDEWEEKYGVSTNVTGSTPIQIDVSERLTAALLPFGLLVVGLSLVLLAAVFRSVWVPVKATLGYLLSVGAAFGATALVFNYGWLKEVVNLEKPVPVISFLPILLMGILFGLAMDYEVFLVSRIREEYVHGKSPLEAIRGGFVASGPVVMAAAVIMVAVFAFFVPQGMSAIKPIAFALAVGVAVDAFLVRMTLVPAVLALLGERAWWLPKWLDRILPTFDVEGEVLSTEMALKGWPGDGSLLFAEGLAVEGVVGPINLRLVPGNVIGLVGPSARAPARRWRSAGAWRPPAGVPAWQGRSCPRPPATRSGVASPTSDLAHGRRSRRRARPATKPGTWRSSTRWTSSTTPEARAALDALVDRVRTTDPAPSCCAPPSRTTSQTTPWTASTPPRPSLTRGAGHDTRDPVRTPRYAGRPSWRWSLSRCWPWRPCSAWPGRRRRTVKLRRRGQPRRGRHGRRAARARWVASWRPP